MSPVRWIEQRQFEKGMIALDLSPPSRGPDATWPRHCGIRDTEEVPHGEAGIVNPAGSLAVRLSETEAAKPIISLSEESPLLPILVRGSKQTQLGCVLN